MEGSGRVCEKRSKFGRRPMQNKHCQVVSTPHHVNLLFDSSAAPNDNGLLRLI